MCKNCFGTSWTNQTQLMDFDFANDIVPLANTKTILREATSNVENAAKNVGLKINSQKTKVMQVGTLQVNTPIMIVQKRTEDVSRFIYLGSTITEDGDV